MYSSPPGPPCPPSPTGRFRRLETESFFSLVYSLLPLIFLPCSKPEQLLKQNTFSLYFQSYCCKGEIDNTKVGGCTLHARKCGADLGLFIKLSSCQLVILSGKHSGGFYPAPYVDRFGKYFNPF